MHAEMKEKPDFLPSFTCDLIHVPVEPVPSEIQLQADMGFMVKILLVLSTLVFFIEAAPGDHLYDADTPRTGSKWPPYPNADKDFWSLQAEQLEEYVRVKKVAGDPNAHLSNDKDNQIVTKTSVTTAAASSTKKKLTENLGRIGSSM